MLYCIQCSHGTKGSFDSCSLPSPQLHLRGRATNLLESQMYLKPFPNNFVVPAAVSKSWVCSGAPKQQFVLAVKAQGRGVWVARGSVNC